MSEDFNKLILESIPNQQRANELVGRLFEVTQPGVVFSEPVTQGEHTVISASEVSVAMGPGYGGGGGAAPASQAEGAAGDGERNAGLGVGSGGGGGGTAMSRPVAVIAIGPDGVHVEPIVDPTKIALAMFTTVGAIFMTLGRIRRFRKTGKLG
jgi:uncharacterized spore protein YtfJ